MPLHTFARIGHDGLDDWEGLARDIHLSQESPHELVQLNDEFVWKISDTLRWIPTVNPTTFDRQFGLNLYGVTAVDGRGARIASDIFRAWADLLALGPEVLNLRGEYGFEGPPAEGAYACLELDRSSLVGALRRLAEWTRHIAGQQHGFVLHLGV